MDYQMQFSHSTETARKERIDPRLAEEMLKTSAGNRKIRQHQVDDLAAAISRGEWRSISQCIGFNVRGQLIDGHHRLNAVVKSGVSIETIVVYGLPLDAVDVTDIGVKRSYADRLNLPASVSQVLRLGCQYATGTKSPSLEQMRPYIEAGFLDVIDRLQSTSAKNERYFGSAPLKLSACIEILAGEDENFVFSQYRALCKGDFDSMTSASKALYKQVFNETTRAAQTDETIARGRLVFSKVKQNLKMIKINPEDRRLAVNRVFFVLNSLVDAEVSK